MLQSDGLQQARCTFHRHKSSLDACIPQAAESLVLDLYWGYTQVVSSTATANSSAKTGSMLVAVGIPVEEAESMVLNFEMAMQDVPRSSSCSDHDGNHS